MRVDQVKGQEDVGVKEASQSGVKGRSKSSYFYPSDHGYRTDEGDQS